jgi:hypothetical protein
MRVSEISAQDGFGDQRATWAKSASTRTGDAVKAGTGTSSSAQTGNTQLSVQGLKRDIAPTYMAQWANPKLMRPEAHIQLQNIWDRLQACLEALVKRLLEKSLKSQTSEDLLANEMMKWQKRDERGDQEDEEESEEEESSGSYHGFVALDQMTQDDSTRQAWVETVSESLQGLIKAYCGRIRVDQDV